MRWLAVLLFALPVAAAAQAPVVTPARDVDVLYAVAQPGKPETLAQRVRWDVAGARQRIDPPTPGLHIIVDLHARRVASVRDAQRLVMEIAGIGGAVPEAAASGYQRRGEAIVAGLACTIWQSAGADSPLLCFTADGVLLRVASGGKTVAEAVSVRYGPSDPDLFRVPDDYRRVFPTGLSAAVPEETKP